MLDIEFRFAGLSEAYQTVFTEAAKRWCELLPEPLPEVDYEGETTDGIIIDAQGVRLDGPGQVLGSAGPTVLRPGATGLPVAGIMMFDLDDLAQLESANTLVSVILHEMGHVLGIGTLWEERGLLAGTGSDDPVFTGDNAKRAYQELRGEADLVDVPVANTGGPGTREGHWREAVFQDELMSGFLSGTTQPLSRVTAGSLEDLGYVVDYSAADTYDLPEGEALSLETPKRPFCRHVLRPKPYTLPKSALV